MSDVKTYDAWLKDDGPAALVIREHLMPVEGKDGVVFPATFAAEQGNAPDRFLGGYNIDRFSDGTNVCLIDSVGSQANRIEPLFTAGEYKELVPQVVVKAGEKRVDILRDAGHRAGDAIVRCSELEKELREVKWTSDLRRCRMTADVGVGTDFDLAREVGCSLIREYRGPQAAFRSLKTGRCFLPSR